MLSSAFSIEGPRGNNQDCYLTPVVSARGWVAAVADGVGGRPGGEVAALEAISAARDSALSEDWSGRATFLNACFRIRDAESKKNLSQTATTMSLVRLAGDQARVAHVGDTRIYHVRGRGIVSRTEDHTELATLLRNGVLSKSQAKKYPRRNVITSYLSSNQDFELFETEFEVKSEDFIILSSDGAYDIIKKAHIVQEIQEAQSVEFIAERFRQRLLLNGVKDDSTMVIIKI